MSYFHQFTNFIFPFEIKSSAILSVETALVKLHDKKEYAEIKITDTGCGIDHENLKKIFEPFFTNKDKGTGLGLTIVGRIVEGYSGKIKIESNINIGTCCAVWLPAKDEKIQQTNFYDA